MAEGVTERAWKAAPAAMDCYGWRWELWGVDAIILDTLERDCYVLWRRRVFLRSAAFETACRRIAR